MSATFTVLMVLCRELYSPYSTATTLPEKQPDKLKGNFCSSIPLMDYDPLYLIFFSFPNK